MYIPCLVTCAIRPSASASASVSTCVACGYVNAQQRIFNAQQPLSLKQTGYPYMYPPLHYPSRRCQRHTLHVVPALVRPPVLQSSASFVHWSRGTTSRPRDPSVPRYSTSSSEISIIPFLLFYFCLLVQILTATFPQALPYYHLF